MQHIRPGVLQLALTASLLLWTSVAVTPAMAGPVTFQFSGIVTNVGTGTPTAYSISNGSILNGFYLMDPTNLPLLPGGNPVVSGDHATYTVDVKNLTFSLGGLLVNPLSQTYTLARSVNVSTSSSTGGQSYVTSTSFNSPEVASLEIGYFGGSGYVSDINALSSTGPSINSFDTTRFRVYFLSQSNIPVVEGYLTVTPVPLPPSAILFGAGLVASAGLGAGNWRQRNRAS